MDLVKESILKAGAFTFLMITVGLLIGLQADDARKGYLEEEMRETNLETETFFATQRYLEDTSRNYCDLVAKKVPDVAERNAQLGRDLQSFSSKSISSPDSYKYLRNKYYVNQLQLYTMLREYKDRCNTNGTTILFFFDNSIESRRQGAVLTEYRKENKQAYIFSYNVNAVNSTVVELLTTDYKINNTPAIVVNGKDVYRRYVSEKELKQVVR